MLRTPLICLMLAAAASAAVPEYRVMDERSDRLVARLPNRMIVAVQEIHTAPVVSVQVWIKTGSVYEQEHVGAGLSHFLEHLLSGGTTTTRPESESNFMLGQMGAQTNAATGLDTVRYYINTTSEHTATAIDLLTDWMRNAKITEDEYQRERDVIQSEFSMGQGDPGRVFWKLTQQARYLAHPARHPTIGYLDEFLDISRDEIYAFYRRMYVPNNMVFVVSGDVDKQAVLERISSLWADVAPGSLPELTLPIEGRTPRVREVAGEASIDRPRVRFMWPGTQLADPGDYELDLLAQVLGQSELSPLVQIVRDKRRLATSIQAYNASFAWGAGFFGVDAVLNVSRSPELMRLLGLASSNDAELTDDQRQQLAELLADFEQQTEQRIDEVRQVMLEQIEQIQNEGVGEEELERAKRKTLAYVMYDAQTAQSAASRLAQDILQMGDPDYLTRYAREIQSITSDELKAAARKFLQADRMVRAKLMPLTGPPAKLQRPAESEQAAELAHKEVELDNAALIDRMQELEAPAEAREAGEVGPIEMHTLANGLRVLLQRNPRLPVVAMQWYHLGGLLADEAGREGVANAMASMMIKGAAGRTADEISRRLEDLGAQLGTNSGNSTFYVTGQCLSRDWRTVLGLMADVIQRPDFPEDEWSKIRPRLLAAIASQNDHWAGQLRNAFREAYFGEHPWSQPIAGQAEVVRELTAADLRAFHRARIAAPDGVLAVFGDIDPDAVRSEVEKRFGEMPAEAGEPFERKVPDPTTGRLVQVATQRPPAAAQIGFAPGLARSNPDYGSVLVMTKVLSNFPVGWFEQALRGSGEGLVYAVGAGQMTGMVPGYWAVLFNTHSPRQVPEAMSEALAVIERIKTQPVDEPTLNRARTAALVGEALGVQSNGQRAAEAALDELYGIGYEGADLLHRQIRQTDAERILEVAKRYLARPVGVVTTPAPVPEEALPDFSAEKTTAPVDQ